MCRAAEAAFSIARGRPAGTALGELVLKGAAASRRTSANYKTTSPSMSARAIDAPSRMRNAVGLSRFPRLFDLKHGVGAPPPLLAAVSGIGEEEKTPRTSWPSRTTRTARPDPDKA